jgi:hypothetical protein
MVLCEAEDSKDGSSVDVNRKGGPGSLGGAERESSQSRNMTHFFMQTPFNPEASSPIVLTTMA